MNIEKIRKDFSRYGRDGLVYLDTAATSLTPECVIDKMNEYYRKYRANIHRGLYKTAEKATEEYEKARKLVADFIGADKDEIVFTAGATASSNMLTYALENTFEFKRDDEIVTTVMEHHASLLPLQSLAKRKKLMLKHISFTKRFELDYAEAEKLITKKTKIVSAMLASNVFGTVNDIARISKIAHDVGALMIVDATAGVGHISMNVKELDADFLYFSGHKMCGPTGVGVLYGKKEKLKKLEPGFVGGGIVEDVGTTCAEWCDIPERFEAGTQNIAGVIGLGRAVEYLDNLGIENIKKHTEDLVVYAQEKLREIEGVRIYSASYEKNVGILSFNIDGVHAHDTAEVLAQNGIAVRAGHHCAMPLHKEIDVPATVRASFYIYNTKEDIDILVEKIKLSKKIFEQ